MDYEGKFEIYWQYWHWEKENAETEIVKWWVKNKFNLYNNSAVQEQYIALCQNY